MNIETFESQYEATTKHHKYISSEFIKNVNSEPILKQFRDFVEQHVYGFGEREFIWLHNMLVEDLDGPIKFLEIGVYKGQIPALYRILSKLHNKDVEITGVTPLDSTDGHIESDYMQNIKDLHDEFKLEYPRIIKGLSTDQDVIERARGMYDIIFIDGGHQYEVVKSDLENYLPMVRKGGYLVVDDCANNIEGAYFGRFWGIVDVSRAVDELLPPRKRSDDWKHVGNVIHNRIWRRL